MVSVSLQDKRRVLLVFRRKDVGSVSLQDKRRVLLVFRRKDVVSVSLQDKRRVLLVFRRKDVDVVSLYKDIRKAQGLRHINGTVWSTVAYILI